MKLKKGDRIVWNQRRGTVMAIDTSAQNTDRAFGWGWQVAAWVLFDGRDEWSCVNALDCTLEAKP